MFAPNQTTEFYSPIYDSYQASSGATMPANLIMFANPQNQTNGPEITNMKDSGKLSAGESIDVQAIRVQFIGAAKADIIAVMKAYQISLVYGGTAFYESTVDATPGGGGIYGDANNGAQDPRAVYNLPPQYPILITAGPIFNVVLKCGGVPPTLTAALFFRVYLDGLRRKLAA